MLESCDQVAPALCLQMLEEKRQVNTENAKWISVPIQHTKGF